tara:strand:+ start:227 stop:364 length:138 start_codon:yes stop_codon:yes gene_type:complete
MMTRKEVQQVVNLLYRLEEIYEYNNTDIGSLIGAHVDRLQDKLKQ